VPMTITRFSFVPTAGSAPEGASKWGN
jgi:hypothetical protein